MITRFSLIRHAESEMNAKFPHLVGGRSNHTPLTDKGILQSQKLGRRFKIENPHFDAVYSSPAVRTQGTARIAYEAWGIAPPKIIIDDRLQEVSQGDWEGQLRTDHYTPEVIAQVVALQGHHKAPNGESQYDVEERMMSFINECLENHAGGHIALYSHGVAIKCVGRHVQNWDARKTYYTELENTSISAFAYHHDIKEWRLGGLNDHAHLTLL